MRPQAIYRYAAIRTARRGRRRHLFRSPLGSYATSLCGDAQATSTNTDDALSPRCTDCDLVALTELSLAVDAMGLEDLAVRIASHARDASFETHAAQSA